jgi:peptide deformylase
MSIRPIARLGEPILRKVADPVAPERIGTPWFRQLVDDLVETMHAASGAGIAAPQIFESVAVCVLEVSKNDRYPTFPEIPLTVLVNPTLTELPGDRIAIYEGCLSVPGLRGRVSRPNRVRLEALGPEGEPISRDVVGVEAAILQHEVDHLFGRLFVDRADPLTLTFLDEYERNIPREKRVIDPFVD